MSRHQSFAIGGRRIGADERPYVIAEVSANHNGSIDRALDLVDAAHQAGADAVKLQTYTADTMTIDLDTPDFRIRGGLWDGQTLYGLYREAHTPWEWHGPLFERGRKHGMAVFSSPFDETAVDFLETLDAPAYKIASFELLDLPLIRRVARAGKPIIMSTGMASLDEIGEAIGAARDAGAGEIALLHCVSGYPTPANEANLQMIRVLQEKFGMPVGLSDHTLDIGVAVAAVASGAVMIEKHFTLSRADGGPDAAFSAEPDEMAALVRNAGLAAEACRGEGFHRSASEDANRRFRRSLYVVADIPQGGQLTRENIRAIRPGFGLPPKHYDNVLGKRATRAVARGTPLSWDLIGE
jgi:N-acetylneuraminate synthase